MVGLDTVKRYWYWYRYHFNKNCISSKSTVLFHKVPYHFRMYSFVSKSTVSFQKVPYCTISFNKGTLNDTN